MKITRQELINMMNWAFEQGKNDMWQQVWQKYRNKKIKEMKKK